MTFAEARRALGEMRDSLEPEHVRELEEKLKKEDKKPAKSTP